MIEFKDFITEAITGEKKHPLEKKHPVLFNFLHHLSSPMIGANPDKHEVYESTDLSDSSLIAEEAKHPDVIVSRGNEIEAQTQAAAGGRAPSVRQRIRAGFHAAIPEGEHPEVTKQKAKESREHFRQFMHKEAGHAENNKLTILSQNGKTKSSAGEGRNTVGLSLAPHSTGTATSDKNDKSGHRVKGHFDVCPSASAECRKSCLGLTAGGNRQYPENSLRAKVIRQRYMVEHPEHTARLLSHEIGENEKWCKDHNTVHDKEGNIVGHKNKKTGKVDSASVKANSHADVSKKLASGEFHEKPIKSGVRLNVTSDLQHHNLHPKSFFERHKESQFYDYTKNRSTTNDDLPSNYTVGLSHTGDNHVESNSDAVVTHLKKGGIANLVYKRGKDHPKPKRVKVHGSKEGEHEWEVVDGDSDDNLDQRHEAAAKIHDQKAKDRKADHAAETDPIKKASHAEAIAHHTNRAEEYRGKKRGIVSGLELKGVKNEAAGHFANDVDEHGTIWLHPKSGAERKTIPIKSVKENVGELSEAVRWLSKGHTGK